MDYIKSNVTAGFCFCLYYFVILCIFLFLQNVVMQLWTWCLSFIGLHWYCEYTQKVSPNCICYSCKCRCVANEIEFCCSCYLGVLLLKLSFMVFYRSLNVIVRDGNVLDAEWTRSQPFHSSATEWSGLEWRMRGVILRPDTEFPAFSPSVQSKESTGNATFIWSQIGIFFICTYKCAPLYKCASIFSQLHTLTLWCNAWLTIASILFFKFTMTSLVSGLWQVSKSWCPLRALTAESSPDLSECLN